VKRVLLAFALAVAGTGAPYSQGAPAVEGPSYRSVDMLEARMLDRLNSHRLRQGLAPLRVSRALSSAAHNHSEDMARNGFCGHDSANGTSFRKRVSRYYGRSSGWRLWSAGENVLCHPRRLTAAAALGRWLASPAHRANVLSAQWRDVGLAAVYTDAAPGVFRGDDVLLVTADFGLRQ
jgi:uncharacterized protein YkwD